MDNYQVKISQFTGPLDKLLQFIEERHLDITQISLAEVTGDFLGYIKGLGGAEPRILADFLVVAGQLVLIKSKALLPTLELTEEEKEDVQDLETRLKIYREFKLAGERLLHLWEKGERSFGRKLFAQLGDQSFFYPPKKLAPLDLAFSLNKLMDTLKELLPQATEKIKRAIITIESKVQDLLRRFQQAGEHSFRGLAKEKPRQEVIALFLAILHLLKDQLIQVEQKEGFSDIILKKHINGH